MTIRVKNLRLRTMIGVNEWERTQKQDVVIQIEYQYDADAASRSDAIAEAVDYKAMKQRILADVEQSQFNLLETLAEKVLTLVMRDSRVVRATVEVEKPHALRFADGVSASLTAQRTP